MSIYAIGMSHSADRTQLKMIPTSDQYVWMFTNFTQFAAEATDLSYDACRILPSGNLTCNQLREIVMEDIGVGETRYIRLQFPNSTILNMEVQNSTLALTLYFSYSVSYPSQAIHDFTWTLNHGGGGTVTFPTSRARRSADPAASESNSFLAIAVEVVDGPQGCPLCRGDVNIQITATEET